MGTETKPQYSPGLAGVIAGETAICWVDPAAGLMYRGYDIHGMAEKATFEEVAYLLLNGELPNAKQLKDFTQQIASERGLPGPVTEMLRLLPGATHPMDMLRTGVSMLGSFDKDLNDYSHDANCSKIDSTDCARFHFNHGRLAHLARRKAVSRETGADAGGEFLLQVQRQNSRAMARRGCSTQFSIFTPTTNTMRPRLPRA
jgi:citrate synthase